MWSRKEGENSRQNRDSNVKFGWSDHGTEEPKETRLTVTTFLRFLTVTRIHLLPTRPPGDVKFYVEFTVPTLSK